MKHYYGLLFGACAALGFICWKRGHRPKRQLAGENMGRLLCMVCDKPQDVPESERFLRGAVRSGEGLDERFRKSGG